MNYTPQIDNLPITPHLDEICTALKASESRFLILSAETAAGKSTAVPLALLEHFSGKILMLEPRRLATIAIASRIAALLGENVGESAGYRMHGENKTGKSTRLEVITQAILTRMLQSDPSLEGVSVVVIDEFHERSIHADLALAFLKESMILREDLFVIVMSATIETTSLSAYLENASVFAVKGRQFPVEIEYKPNTSVSRAVKDELFANTDRTILAFLPGLREILKAKDELSDTDAEILVLHSSISSEEQKKVLTPAKSGTRRVILSSAIAETSLTVPDVTIVIDSGLSRTVKMNPATGMERLITERESVFSAEQRAGRAGRVREGRCVRLWAQNDVRHAEQSAEIERADLLSLVLECAQWGALDIAALDWYTPPNRASWTQAQTLLKTLGCLDEKNAITEKGKAVLEIGENPRLACILLEGKAQNRTDEAVSEVIHYTSYQNRADILRRVKHIRTSGALGVKNLLLAGFPDRIASRTQDFGVYQFPSGRQATLTADEKRKYSVPPAFIIAIEADSGDVQGKISAYKELDEAEAQAFLQARATKSTTAYFSEGKNDDKKIIVEEVASYGEIVLSRRKKEPSLADFKQAVCEAVRKNGVSWLSLSPSANNFLLRARFLAETGDIVLQEKLDTLCETAGEWLSPFITEKSLREESVFNALCYYLDDAKINRDAPQSITLENGKTRRLIYEDQGSAGIVPVLEIIIQQIFGVKETPRVHGVPVLLRLLSPASRPLQVTRDLAGFWANTWADICREMKGRYPKHNWQQP